MHVYSVLLVTRRHVKGYPGESYGINTITTLAVLIFGKGRNRVRLYMTYYRACALHLSENCVGINTVQ